MSVTDVPPPTRGTTPLLRRSKKPALRPHREEPAIANADRESGQTRHTDEARRARVETVAHDLAAADPPGDEPLRPRVGHALIAGIYVNVAVVGRDTARARAAADRRTLEARTAVRNADDVERTATLEARRARSEVPEQPVGGTQLTSPLLLLVITGALGYLEVAIGAPAIRVALATNDRTATLAAIAIAIGLTLAAHGLGLVLAAVARGSRRAARTLLTVVALAVVAAGVWSVVSLAASRTNNLAQRDALRAAGAQSSDAGSALAGALSRQATRASVEDGAAAAPKERSDLRFMVPLVLLTMLAGSLISMRSGLAHEWKGATRRAREAEDERADAMAERRRADAAVHEAEEQLSRANMELAAMAERETATVGGLLDHFRDEYARWCSRFGTRRRELELPALPTAQAVVETVAGPLGATVRVPGPAPGGAEPVDGGPSGNGGGPSGDGAPGPEGGVDGARNGSGVGPATDAPPPGGAGLEPDGEELPTDGTPAGWCLFDDDPSHEPTPGGGEHETPDNDDRPPEDS